MLRALPSGVLNAIIFIIWHIKHKKQSIIRCVICAKIMRHAIVRSHFLDRTDENTISVYYYFIHLSLSILITLFLFFPPLLSHSSLDIPINTSLLPLFFLLIVVTFLSSVQPRCATRCRLVVFFFFFWCNDLMGGFGNGCV